MEQFRADVDSLLSAVNMQTPVAPISSRASTTTEAVDAAAAANSATLSAVAAKTACANAPAFTTAVVTPAVLPAPTASPAAPHDGPTSPSILDRFFESRQEQTRVSKRVPPTVQHALRAHGSALDLLSTRVAGLCGDVGGDGDGGDGSAGDGGGADEVDDGGDDGGDGDGDDGDGEDGGMSIALQSRNHRSEEEVLEHIKRLGDLVTMLDRRLEALAAQSREPVANADLVGAASSANSDAVPAPASPAAPTDNLPIARVRFTVTLASVGLSDMSDALQVRDLDHVSI